MSIVGLKFRAYADGAKARPDAACVLHNALRSADIEAYRWRGSSHT